MKCLIGESIAFKLNPEETAAAMIWRKRVASIINRAIRREKAKAWDEAINTMERVRSYVVARRENHYRGRARR